MLLVETGNSLSGFRSWEDSVEMEDLISDLVSGISGGILLQHFVIQVVLSSNDFDLVKVKSIVRSDKLAEEEHLESVDFISVEIGVEKTGVRVGSVKGLLDGQIWELTQIAVHGVILSIGVVQVSSGIFVLSIFSQNSLEQLEGEKVFMVP